MFTLAFLSVCMDSCSHLRLRFSVFVWTLVLVLVFHSCLDSCACACVSPCLHGLLCLRLRFSRQCLYGLLCLSLRFSVFVWTLVFALAFLSVYLDSCSYTCVSQCLYGLSVCSQCLYGLLFLCSCFLLYLRRR